MIGKRGQTIDAIQYLATAIVFRGPRRARASSSTRPAIATAAGRRSSSRPTGPPAKCSPPAGGALDRCPRSSARSSTCTCRSAKTSRRRARVTSPTASSSFVLSDAPRPWLAAVIATPGLTAIRTTGRGWQLLLHVAVAAAALLATARRRCRLRRGSPGIPLAAARPDLDFVLLEAKRRKCGFLERTRPIANVSVLCERAEETGRCRPGRYGRRRRALAPPPVAAEWCLPLVRPGGPVILFVGPSADPPGGGRAASGARRGELEESPPGFLVLQKLAPTPEGFPRRPGMARKRPLA